MENRAVATLTVIGDHFVENGMNGNLCYMTTNELHISGKDDARKGLPIARLDNGRVSDSHVQLKYNPSEKSFKLAALGEVKLNGRKVPKLVGAGTPDDWVNLPDNSGIFINDEIQVNFKIKK